MLKSVAISQVLDRIRFENPWWNSGAVDPYFQNMPHRAYFGKFVQVANNLEVHRSVVLMGPRRVGKTVMLYHLVQHLLNQSVNPRRILFITVENPIYNHISLEQLFTHGRTAAGAEQDLNGM